MKIKLIALLLMSTSATGADYAGTFDFRAFAKAIEKAHGIGGEE